MTESQYGHKCSQQRATKNRTVVRFVDSDPDRTRTYNQLIKSQLLCQLSYGANFTSELYRIAF
jgi:hypothetical protein